MVVATDPGAEASDYDRGYMDGYRYAFRSSLEHSTEYNASYKAGQAAAIHDTAVELSHLMYDQL